MRGMSANSTVCLVQSQLYELCGSKPKAGDSSYTQNMSHTYSATRRKNDVCRTIAPSPAGFDEFIHLAENQFSWIDVTISAPNSNMLKTELL